MPARRRRSGSRQAGRASNVGAGRAALPVPTRLGPVATVERSATPTAPSSVKGLLFNPATYDPADFDPEARRLLLATIEFFESRGKAALKEHDHERVWYADFLEFVKRERVFATLLTPAARGGRRRRTSAGTPRASARSTRSSPSTGSATGTRGRSRSSGSARSGRATTRPRAARAAELLEDGRDLRVRPLRAGARRRHLLDRHGPHARTATAASAPTAASTTSATATWPAWCRSSAAAPTSRAPTATSSSPPTAGHPAYQLVKNVVNSQMYVSEFRLDDYPVARRGRPAHRPGRVRRRAEHGQRRQVQPRLRLDRHLRARLLRGDHARRRPRPLRQAGHRLPARAPGAHRRLRAPGRDEAVRRPGDRLLPLARAPTTAATCSSTRSRR